MLHFLKAKKERGTILIVFDPRYSRTAALADIWVPFRSGTETAILLYILHYAFFERKPPIDELDEFKRLKSRWNVTDGDLADLKELLKDYSAENVSRITGVPVDLLRTVAQIFVENSGVVTGHKRHGMIQWAMGLTQHTNATVNIIRAVAIVQLLLGNVGYPGGGLHAFRGWSNVQGCTDVQCGPGVLPGYHPAPASPDDVRKYQKWKLGGMPPDFKFYGWRRLELAWGLFCGTIPEDDPDNGIVVCDLPLGPGATEITFPRRALAGEIKAAFIFGENVAVTNPNAKLIMAALASLDFLVVSDIFESETAWFADVLLPAASFAEKEGTRTTTSRVIQWTYRAVPPKGDSRPEYWIVTKLYQYLRRHGAILLPSEAAGIKSESVKFKRGGTVVLVYERPLKPDASWDYSGGAGRSAPISPMEAEANPRIINKEINFAVLIYHGIYDPVRDEFTTMRKSTRIRLPGEIDGAFSQKFGIYKDWGWSWPMNVRVLYCSDALSVMFGIVDKVQAAGKVWEVTGETGEWIDETTGEYVPAFVPGHGFGAPPKTYKRKLSGIADVFGGLDVIHFVRTGEAKVPGKFVVEEGGEVKVLSYDEFVARTGWRYLWANDTLYWDAETLKKASLKYPYFKGGDWRSFKPTYQRMRELLRKYYEETKSLREATLRVISEMGGWYAGYNFQWPIHTEPAEAPVPELAIEYPTLAWINPHNLMVLKEEPDIVRGKNVGVALTPDDLKDLPGELVVITSNRLTEHWHSGQLSRNLPYLAELVPEPFVFVPRRLAERLGIKSGDYVDVITLRGSVRMRAYVTDGIAYLKIDGREIPVISVVWSFSFLGRVTGPQGNFLTPDVGDVITTIQESKAWIGKIKRAELA
jgi:formate dehydrogenase major subunit